MTIFDFATDWIGLMQMLMLSSVRLFAVFTLLPFFGRATLPGVVRNGFVLALALVVLPSVYFQQPPQGFPPNAFFLLLLKEIFIGMAIGYLVSIVFWAAAGIGAYLDTQRGAAIANIINPQFGDQSTPLGDLLNRLVATIMMVGGGFLVLLDAVYESYRTWPVFSFTPTLTIDSARFFLEQFDFMMYLVVFLAGPAVIAMFAVEFGLALMNRFVPQLNVFVLAMAIKSAAGVFLLILYFSSLTLFFRDEFRETHQHFEILDVLFR